MLPRRQSIFHLGEEGGVAAVHHHHHHRGCLVMPAGGMRRPREREQRPVVGLQILVRQHHHHHHGRHAHAANVVLKPMVRPLRAAVSCSFLKSCSRCRMELSPTKDVYMYRGDQGFCSEECRWQQILVDEALERAASSKERQRRGQAPRHHIPHPHQGRPPRKALAVAH